MASMKTTIDIQDQLYVRAKLLARNEGRTVRSIVEEGLRHCLSEAEGRGRNKTYALEDLSVGESGSPNPLESMSWDEIRDEIYGGL